MPTCNQEDNEANRELAKQTGYNYHYDVGVVVVDRHEDQQDPTKNTITFLAYGTDENWHRYTARWGDTRDMWAACPSSLPSKATATNAGAPPERGAAGILYLSEQYVTNSAHNAPGIKTLTPPKWPKYLAGPVKPLHRLRIWPTSVVVSGYELVSRNGQPELNTIELMDFVNVGERMVVFRGQPVEVDVSADIFLKFSLPFSPLFPVESPWTALTAAVAEVKGEGSDPRKMAAAWTTVAQCIEQLESAREAGLVSAQHEAELRSVLPTHPALKDVML